MSILTTPFKTIAKTEPESKSLYYPGIEDSTELTIVPTATEVWAIEGLNLNFSLEYFLQTLVNVEAPGEALETRKERLAEIEGSRKLIQERRKKAYEKEASETHLIELEEATAELNAVKVEVASANSEYIILGRQAAKERSENPAIIILVRLFTRGNELVYDSVITPTARSLTFKGFEPPEGVTTYANVKVREIVNSHVEFDNPIHIGERENLTLTFQFIGPSAPYKEKEGEEGVRAFTGGPPPEEISIIQANVNYSRTTT